MKRSRTVNIRLASFLLMMVMAFTCLPAGALADEDELEEEIEELEQKIEDLDKEIDGYNDQLDGLADDMTAVMERKAIIDAKIAASCEQIAAIEEIIAVYEAEIGTLEQDIAAAQQELAAAQAAAAETYQEYCERVRALEEGGYTTYWGIIFGATSFDDMLSRIDFVSEVLSYNEQIILEYNAVCDEIAARESALQAQLSEKQDIILANQQAQAELQALTEQLELQRAYANELILEIHNNQDEYQGIIDAIEDEKDEIEDLIDEKEKELEEERRKAAAAAAASRPSGGGGGGSGSVGSGAYRGYIWPCSSRRITSYFGPRPASATNGIGSTNHGAIDIGAVYYSTPVVASKAGTVTIATYSSSYGNYVVINHGDGSTTLYAHMSYLVVSAGQYVAQGQQLGVTGSTGNSTGPHLHFEIRINGVKVDPLLYLP